MVKLSTPRLTCALDVITERQAPLRNGMSRPKMRYAHQGGESACRGDPRQQSGE